MAYAPTSQAPVWGKIDSGTDNTQPTPPIGGPQGPAQPFLKMPPGNGGINPHIPGGGWGGWGDLPGAIKTGSAIGGRIDSGGGQEQSAAPPLGDQNTPPGQTPNTPGQTPPPPTPGGGAQPPPQTGWDANRVSDYFKGRGVTPNSTSPDYWAQKWNEWGSKDPAYFEQRLAQADEFGGGGGSQGGGGGGPYQAPTSPSTYATGFPSAPTANPGMQTQAPDVSNAFQAGQSGGIITNPNGLSTSLQAQLAQRAGQSLNIDPYSDSVIRPQVDAARAEFTRGARDTINDTAESGNPYATGALQSSRVQAGERAGQQTAGLQSQLVQNELSARRNEIQQALSQQGSMLSQDQQLSLQRQLAQVNANLQKYQLQGQFELGNRGLGLQQQGVTNQNSQFYNGMSQQDQQFLKNLQLQYAGLNQQGNLAQQGINSNNDQFAANFGANNADRQSYWDAINSGRLR